MSEAKMAPGPRFVRIGYRRINVANIDFTTEGMYKAGPESHPEFTLTIYFHGGKHIVLRQAEAADMIDYLEGWTEASSDPPSPKRHDQHYAMETESTIRQGN